MSKPFDATTKDLIETDPAGWVTYLGCPVSPSAVRMVDADLSTVTTDADKVICVDEGDRARRWLLHLDIQTSGSWEMERRLLRYNALLHHRHGLPVASAVVLLRREAQMAWLSGALDVAPPVGPAWQFRYAVIRLWERPAHEFLTGPLGLVPLAPLAATAPADLPAVVSDMRDRIDAQPDRPLAAKLWAATYVLMGLRFNSALIDNVLSGVLQMEESVTYQAIIQRGMERGLRTGRAEGRADGLRESILALGEEKFGAPTAEQAAALAAIADADRLHAMSKKLLRANTWGELLAD